MARTRFVPRSSAGYGRGNTVKVKTTPYAPRDPQLLQLSRVRGQGSRTGGRSDAYRARTSSRTPGGGPPSSRAPDFNPNAAIGGALADIAAFYEAELGKIRASGGGGGGFDSSPYDRAIAEATELLGQVQANRKAVGEVQAARSEFINPLSEEAIAAALEIVAKGAPQLKAIAKEGKQDIEGNFDAAESIVAEMAALIGAGKGAQEVATDDVIDGEALRIAAEMEAASAADSRLGFVQEAARTQAVSDKSLDEDEFSRRSKLVDIEFEQMEDGLNKQIEEARFARQQAARAAARAAAAAARQRRDAISALEGEKARAMRLNPHEAGEATALQYLRGAGSNLDYNRQQLILSTVSNAISTQVPANRVYSWARDQQLPMKKNELDLVRNAIRAYTSGMRHQQNTDYRRRTPTSALTGRG